MSENPARHLSEADAIAAHPILDNVGDLARLLSQLPPDMALTLDQHVRADPAEPAEMYTVTPRLVGMADDETAQTVPGLQLGTVYVPAEGDENAQAAAAVRGDLLPENLLARAGARILDGRDLQAGLKDLTGLLQEVGLLLGEGAKWLSRDDPAMTSLQVEADRIQHAAARITQLADTVESPEW
ncbi:MULTISPECIES: hypothetical protein [unclassified Streptomyces]|uniref:hypothetical protein n=1 Tax=unclassified Streptomyces TaxID=2593676 RepID=UPI0008239C66|nr:hypothetical protein [Streptomyces sp. AmelKG-E11A]SCK55673.1 hypothetical protein YW7DRAFT_05158 [Streptomyces sp. AmelKG-E11A]